MFNLSASEIDQLVYLLIFNFIAGVFLGLLIGWFVRHRYDAWLWFKRGLYCDDCAPLVHPSFDSDSK